MSAGTQSSVQVEERAAEWLTRRDSGDWSEADERELQSWLDESTANEVAFIRLEAAWSAADRLQAFGAGASIDDIPAPDEWHLPPAAPTAESKHHPRRRFIALAASVLLAAIGIVAWQLGTRGTTYSTIVGGLSSVPMKDGSVVTLNTNSQVTLDLGRRQRAVKLERGEAYFEVAHDAARPFVVTAGHQRITAVGTQFAVRRDESGAVQVVVTEGKVRLEDDASPEPMLLGAGGIARVGADGLLLQPLAQVEVEQYVSWRTGFLVFRDVPLANVAAEFNRYNERKVLVRDPRIASLPISGRFRTTNVEAFIRLTQGGFPVQARSVAEGIVLTGTTSQSVTK